MKITKQNIIDWSKIHPYSDDPQDRILKIGNNDVIFSIVGGRRGFYGDFINSFEVAVIDRKTDEFMTKFFFPDFGQDVFGHMGGDELANVLTNFFQKGFQIY